MKICLFDPGIRNNRGDFSANLGDLIIQEAVKRELTSLFPYCEIAHVSTHSYPSKEHIEAARQSDLVIVGGTNLLQSSLKDYQQWKITLKQKFQLGKAVLLGVGWQNYQGRPDLHARVSLQAVLSKKSTHSVRDGYTKEMLQNAGMKNVVNTGCPTMWPFIDFDTAKIPKTKSENALVMLTDYFKNSEADKKILEIALESYKKVFVWAQGSGDAEYCVNLISSKPFPVMVIHEGSVSQMPSPTDYPDLPLTILSHSYDVFNSFLRSNIDFDYIGTRLHGGIKCLLSGRRSLILEIDNRAKEIAKETGLPTTSRENSDFIQQWVNGEFETKIEIDPEPIKLWRSRLVSSNIAV